MSEFAPNLLNGKSVQLYTLSCKDRPYKATVTNYGARLVSLEVANKSGELVDVILGFDSLKGYLSSSEPYFGASVGRIANRISDGKFCLDGAEYTLPKNNGPNCLHGGVKGFHSAVWDAYQSNERSIEFRYISKDLEEGFPGTLDVKVTYTLEDVADGSVALRIDYEASTDKTTVVNLTNHAFFNLNGVECGRDVLEHKLVINAESYLPINANQIPTGKLESVRGTPFDFTTPAKIGSRIEESHEQLQLAGGYDHTYVLKKSGDIPSYPIPVGSCHLAASVESDLSGIKMEVYTQEPGVQFYTGNFLEGKNVLRSGVKDVRRSAFCLETQHFPDSPNQPGFPTTVLKPGELYKTLSVYKFQNV
ncbi:aldose 1-epimerase domain-containing protein [Ditylenchus destructor]|uniref:Aldose 1-epimerase n=1 Tax=Ditylenchus destructor TaxID=166010 RepID=A0AAD4MPZ1_9BILA|nr:aldose 1-epimerase domain-containing protein [Ditylenchus destructor]